MADAPDPKAILQRALAEVKEARTRLQAAERARSEPIAVIGVGCRFPGGIDGPDALWQRLVAGDDCTSEVPPGRWDSSVTYRGGFLREVDRFDARFFRVSPREAAWMDPQHRLLLEVAWEALEDAGLAADRLKGEKVGVFVGITNNDYAHLHGPAAAQGEGGLFHVSGGAFSFAAGRLAYMLDLHGPALAIDTACSSSLVALHLACHSLRSGECDLALVGGVNLMLAPGGFVVLSKAQMLAPDGRCKTFDAAADGYARGEGCGVVVLRRAGDAEAAGDRVLAHVRGTAVNQDGASSGLTVPNGAAQRALIGEALRAAGVAPAAIGYVEAHGTGTPLGDPIEARALGAALGGGRTTPLWIGSVKTNLGHLEAAAGIAGLIKTALVLHHGQVPPSLHFRTPSPHVDLAALGLAVPVAVTPWPEGQPRCAGVSSFGASGTNAHAVLGAPTRGSGQASSGQASAQPGSAQPPAPPRPLELLALSARGEDELRALADRHERGLAGVPEDDFADVCGAVARGRARLDERLVVIAPTAAAAREQLAGFARGQDGAVLRGRVGARRPRVAFLFSGQGAQVRGMASRLLATEPSFRATLERGDAALGEHLGVRLLAMLAPDGAGAGRIDETGLAQPALFAVEFALASLLRSWGVEPYALLGHSVGEIAAACFAGALEFEQALALVATRAARMQALPAGGAMAAVFTDAATARAAIDGEPELAIAAVNAADEVVLSGAEAALMRAVARLELRGVRCRRLAVSHAFHSPLLDPMLDGFAAALASLRPAAPQIRLVSGLTGDFVGAESLGADHWRRQAREPVRFAEGVQRLLAAGVDLFVEIGPQPVLLQAARRATPPGAAVQWLPTLRRDRDDWAAMLATAGALFVAGTELDPGRLFAGRPRRHLTLPTYPFARERHWIDAPAPAPAAPGPLADDGAWLRGAAVESPALSDMCFEHVLTAAASPVLREHKIFGANVISGAVQAALLGRATAAALPGASQVAFADISFRAPLVLDGEAPRRVQIVVSPTSGEVARLQLFSRDRDGWVEHCAASVQAGGALPEARVDLAAIKARCAELLTGDDYYARGWPADTHELGPCFRSIVALWRRDGEALARVELREDVDDGPAALQAEVRACRRGEVSGQVLAATLPGWDHHGDHTAIGLAIGRSVDASRGAPPVVYWHATARAGSGSDGMIGDLQMVDETGRVLSRVERLELGQIARDQLRRALTFAARRARASSLTRATVAAAAADARAGLIEGYLREALAAACGGAPGDVHADRSIRDLGIDSLLAVELRERLAADLELDVPVVELLAGPSLRALTEMVLAQLGLATSDVPERTCPEVQTPRGWLRALGGGGPTQLVCLPYGGGGASAYAGLAGGLAGVAVHAVQLPGREDRIHEAPQDRVDALVAAMLPEIAALRTAGPLVLFGWSMGALLAFELALALGRGDGEPARLIVAACPAPDVPRPAEDLERLREVALQLDPALLAAVEPALRADLRLVAGYTRTDAPPLACPITAIGGRDDHQVGRDALAGWSRRSRGDFDLRILPGGHLLLRTDPGPLHALLQRVLATT